MKIKIQGNELEMGEEEYSVLAKFMNFVIPGVVDKSGIKQDNATFERWVNAQELFLKAQKITENYKSEIKKPPLKISMPLLENASLESEDELQDKWAQLLANSLTEKKDIKPAYIEILKELSSIEVKLLDTLYLEAKRQPVNMIDVQFGTENFVKSLGLTMEDGRLIVDNLFRLRLSEAPAVQGIQMGGFFPVGKTNDVFQLTTLGYKFIEACKFEK